MSRKLLKGLQAFSLESYYVRFFAEMCALAYLCPLLDRFIAFLNQTTSLQNNVTKGIAGR